MLICKAQLKFPSQADDYISVLCALYKPQGPPIPDMDKDTTPPWMIADAVISETNNKDRGCYTDVFFYVFGYSPYIFFTGSN